MHTSRRLAIAVALVATFSLAFPLLTSANHAWANYHWGRTSNTFALQVGDSVASSWDSILDTTISDWSQSTVLDLTKFAAPAAKGKTCNAIGGKVNVCNGSYGTNGWLGLASIWISGVHITQGTVKVNDSYFSQPEYNTTAWRNLVMCQEVGHTLGLDHQDTTFGNANLGTCMDYTSNPSGPPSNEHPNTGDSHQLLCIYDPGSVGRILTTSTHSCTGTGHLDSSTTIGSTVPSAASASSWGRLVAVTNGGRTSVYVAGSGSQTVVTFVIWAF